MRENLMEGGDEKADASIRKKTNSESGVKSDLGEVVPILGINRTSWSSSLVFFAAITVS